MGKIIRNERSRLNMIFVYLFNSFIWSKYDNISFSCFDECKKKKKDYVSISVYIIRSTIMITFLFSWYWKEAELFVYSFFSCTKHKFTYKIECTCIEKASAYAFSNISLIWNVEITTWHSWCLRVLNKTILSIK